MDSQSQEPTFEEIMNRMNVSGEFTISVLASEDGLPVAAAPRSAPYDADTIAAMVALVRDFIQQTQTRLGLAEVDEVSIVVGDRSRLICRYFKVDQRTLVLTVIAPPQHSYRRLMSHAIREMDEAWNR